MPSSPHPSRPLALAAAAVLAACGASPPSDLSQDARGGEPTSIVRARVSAADGGAFSDAAGVVTVRIPPGALNADANLRVRRASAVPAAGPDQTLASDAFEVRLQNDDVALALAQPMTLELRGAPAAHPRLGELARADGSRWERLPSSFYRPSSATVVSTTRAVSGTYAAVHRSLRRDEGPAVARGYDVFAYETFGNEAFFGGALGLHDVLNAVDPVTAVGLGAQVDLARVPPAIVAVMTGDDFAAKRSALRDPATTRALLKAGAVVGVKGVYGDPATDVMTSVGITCALCHETVKPTRFELAPGEHAMLPIGPLSSDGVTNAAMDAGKILSFTPFAAKPGNEALAAALAGWGPNRFDIRALNALDDGVDAPTDTPPIWNFVDLEAQGYGFGWDGLFTGADALARQAGVVFDVVMHGDAAAIDPAQLLDLQSWMRSLASPAPGPFDEAKAEAGWRIFTGKGSCTACHATPELTGPGRFDLTGDLAGGLAGGIRVPGLRGVSRSAPYLHDGRLDTLPEAVEAVTAVVSGVTGATFSAEEKEQLVEYLKSL
ncbi:MAG TPA: hypothetical protein VFL83_02785 [Anaeromyxobacter sp.]|nr:hypothetical protein [Anaeromyxobacter sp.]